MLAEHNPDGSVKSAGTAIIGNGSLHQTRASAEALNPDTIKQYDISDEDYESVFSSQKKS